MKLAVISTEPHWENTFVSWQVEAENRLTLTAGPATDWFIDPAGNYVKDSAPVLLFTPPDAQFLFSAKVTVGFGAAFDAGVLQLRADELLWGKLCFEYSPQQQPMVVSVVTRGVSDDCNGAVIAGNSVYLRIAQRGATSAFHYSLDGRQWHLVRYFTLGKAENLQVGLSAQSPTGAQCTATFAEISYQPGLLEDIRSGA